MNDKKPESEWRFRTEEETHDIYDIHRQAFREPAEPQEGLEHPPWWLWAISVLLIFWAGFYLGRYGGIFGPYTHVLEEGKTVSPVELVPMPEETKPKADGAAVYATVCAACHQANGQGVPGAFPPLADSVWLLKDAETPIRIVLHGLQGPIEVKGTIYNNVMPEWGTRLSNEEIAAVLTYARTSWGNSTDQISPELVDKARSETSNRTTSWTAEELQKLR
ncbi:MAG: c-type cytochrome [Thermodesulfobacteriota bacterium]